MEEVENILKIFENSKKAIISRDTLTLKKLSDQTNNTASRTQDPDNIAVAVIIYSIGKILEREKYKSSQDWKRFYKNILIDIDKLIDALKKKDKKKINRILHLMRNEIENISGRLRIYIQDVFRKAQINKASKIYEHGISMEKTAKLLGITMFELAGYAGQKNNDELSKKNGLNIKERIKLAEEIFK